MTQIDTIEVIGPDPAVDVLLARHHADMRAGSPEESCHVMAADALRQSGARVFALRKDAEVVAVGALKPIAPAKAPTTLPAGPAMELKSMHVAREARGQGLGRALLTGLMDAAKADGALGLCLETGTAESFAPARGLYAAQGFAPCPPFADYKIDPLSVYMALPLTAGCP